jgi:hypothetical protein
MTIRHNEKNMFCKRLEASSLGIRVSHGRAVFRTKVLTLRHVCWDLEKTIVPLAVGDNKCSIYYMDHTQQTLGHFTFSTLQ